MLQGIKRAALCNASGSLCAILLFVFYRFFNNTETTASGILII